MAIVTRLHARLYKYMSVFSSPRGLDLALVGQAPVTGRCGTVHQEAGNLHLADGVECHHANVGIGERLAACCHLTEDLSGVTAAKHGQLPHGPVTVVVVVGSHGAHTGGVGVGHVCLRGAGKLQAGGPPVAGNVVDLAGDLGIGEGGEVGEGLKHPVVLWVVLWVVVWN